MPDLQKVPGIAADTDRQILLEFRWSDEEVFLEVGLSSGVSPQAGVGPQPGKRCYGAEV